MTTNPQEIERKVRQLDNDVQAIYVMLADIGATQGRHTNRLNELQAQIAAHDARFDAIDARFDGIDGRLDGIDARFDGIDGRLDGLAASMDEVLRRLPG